MPNKDNQNVNFIHLDDTNTDFTIGYINDNEENNNPNIIIGMLDIKENIDLLTILNTIDKKLSNKKEPYIFKNKPIKEKEIFHKSDTEKINTFKFKRFKKKKVYNNVFARVLNNFIFFRNNKLGQTLNLTDFRENFMEGEHQSYRLNVEDYKIGMQIVYRKSTDETYILAEVVNVKHNSIDIEYFEWDEDLGQRKEPLNLIFANPTLDLVKPNRKIMIKPMFLTKELEDGTLINFENKVNNIIYI